MHRGRCTYSTWVIIWMMSNISKGIEWNFNNVICIFLSKGVITLRNLILLFSIVLCILDEGLVFMYNGNLKYFNSWMHFETQGTSYTNRTLNFNCVEKVLWVLCNKLFRNEWKIKYISLGSSVQNQPNRSRNSP